MPSVTPAVTIRISNPSSNSAHSCSVGMVDGGSGAATVMVAEAVAPAPLSTEVTAPVVLVFVPEVRPVTFTLKVHMALAARVALVKLTLADPAFAVIVPPPQVPVSPFGVDTMRPAGNVSVKLIPVNAADALGLVRVKVSEVDPFCAMLAEPNDFAMVGAPVLDTIRSPKTARPARMVPPDAAA